MKHKAMSEVVKRWAEGLSFKLLPKRMTMQMLLLTAATGCSKLCLMPCHAEGLYLLQS